MSERNAAEIVDLLAEFGRRAAFEGGIPN